MDGPQMRTRRKALGMTLAEFGEALGLSKDHVGRMERGECPTPARTAAAALALRRPLSRGASMEDPMERMIEEALIDAGVPFQAETENDARLDFYIPDRDVHIEVKRFYTERADAQLQRAPNVILAQGKAAVEMLAAAIRGGLFAPAAK